MKEKGEDSGDRPDFWIFVSKHSGESVDHLNVFARMRWACFSY